MRRTLTLAGLAVLLAVIACQSDAGGDGTSDGASRDAGGDGASRDAGGEGSGGNQPPTVNAGPDVILQRPASAVTLHGTATDADGTVTSYLWTKQSGPLATFAVQNAPDLSLTNLVEGTYVFRLTAIDNDGASAFDDVQVTVNAEAVIGRYYVSPTGSDANPGTEALPFLTIQQAASLVAPGDVVVVEDGTYTYTPGSFFASLSRSGSASSYVTYRARHLGGAVLDGRNNLSVGAFSISASYINIVGFEIKGMSGEGIEARDGSSYLNFSDLSIHDIGRGCYENNDGRTAFTTGNGSYVTIERCLIHTIGAYAPGENGCTYSASWIGYQTYDHGIYIAGTNYLTIKNNVFHDCKSGFGVQFYSGAGHPSSYVDVVNNTFSNGNPFQAAGHIILWNTLSHALIANNIFKNHHAYAMNIYQGSYAYSSVTITKNVTSGGNGVVSTGGASGVTVTGNYDNTDPLFVDEAKYNYLLKPTSPAIDVGYPTGVTTDFLGNARVVIDIGAYEYIVGQH